MPVGRPARRYGGPGWGLATCERAAPALGGRFAGLDPAAGVVILRSAAVLSSLVTGTLVGVVAGAVTLLLTCVVLAEPGRDGSRRSG